MTRKHSIFIVCGVIKHYELSPFVRSNLAATQLYANQSNIFESEGVSVYYYAFESSFDAGFAETRLKTMSQEGWDSIVHESDDPNWLDEANKAQVSFTTTRVDIGGDPGQLLNGAPLSRGQEAMVAMHAKADANSKFRGDAFRPLASMGLDEQFTRPKVLEGLSDFLRDNLAFKGSSEEIKVARSMDMAVALLKEIEPPLQEPLLSADIVDSSLEAIMARCKAVNQRTQLKRRSKKKFEHVDEYRIQNNVFGHFGDRHAIESLESIIARGEGTDFETPNHMLISAVRINSKRLPGIYRPIDHPRGELGRTCYSDLANAVLSANLREASVREGALFVRNLKAATANTSMDDKEAWESMQFLEDAWVQSHSERNKHWNVETTQELEADEDSGLSL